MHRGVFHAVTRRASLLTLGTTGLAALARPIASNARKKKRRNKGDVFKLCKQQIDQCLDFFLPVCNDDRQCQAIVETCCPLLGKCDLDGVILCLSDDGDIPAASSVVSIVAPASTP
jgi:hypothetical protein